jgi:hypothetical protein
MTTIDLSVLKDRRKRAVQRARECNIVIPNERPPSFWKTRGS